MSVSNTTAQPARRHRRRRRSLALALALALAGFAVLAVAAYFVVFSQTFLRKIVLPRLAASLGTRIDVAEISVRPFSRVQFSQLRVMTEAGEPLLRVEDAEADYDLWSLTRGTLVLHEVRLVRPEVYLVLQTNGTSNLDRILRSRRQRKPDDETPPLSVILDRGTVSGGFFQLTRHETDGGRSVHSLSNLDVRLDDAGDGRAGRWSVSADVVSENLTAAMTAMTAVAGGPNLERTTARFEGDGRMALDAVGQPARVQGRLELKVVSAGDRTPPARWGFLGVRLVGEADLGARSADLREARLDFTPTARGGNRVTGRGRIDWSEGGALQGHLAVNATTIDLAPFLAAIGEPPPPELPGSGSSARTPAPSARVPDSRPARIDPEPRTFPFRQFQVSAAVARARLDDLEVTNFQARAVLDGGRVRVDPWSGFLNGREFGMSVNLDASVPGWKYDFAAQLDHIPVEPLVRVFSPGLRDKLNGELVLDARLRGEGLTDARLRENLAGQLALRLTNANMRLTGTEGRARTQTLNRILTLESVVQGAAYLLRLPALMDSPVHWIDTRLEIAEGLVSARHFSVQAQAFSAGTAAEIPLSLPLTQSPLPDIPLHFALERSVAAGANLIPRGTPDHTPFVLLPDFIFLRGTLGNPRPDLKKTALAGLLLKSTAGLPGSLGKDAGPWLQGIGELLTGERKSPGDAGVREIPAPGVVPGLDVFPVPAARE